MMTWFDQQRLRAAQHERQRAEQEQLNKQKGDMRRTPMKERVARIIRALPPEERDLPRSLRFFVEQLKPKFSGARAAPRDVARGLRELGWTRTRAWRSEAEGFRALWIPPTN